MISLALPCSLLCYVIKFHLEGVFDFMLFVTMWLQLELACRLNAHGDSRLLWEHLHDPYGDRDAKDGLEGG